MKFELKWVDFPKKCANCRHGGGGSQKSGQIADLVYGWPQMSIVEELEKSNKKTHNDEKRY